MALFAAYGFGAMAGTAVYARFGFAGIAGIAVATVAIPLLALALTLSSFGMYSSPKPRG